MTNKNITYQKVQGMLYRHYSNKLKQERYKRKIKKLQEQKKRIRDDIYQCNIEFHTDLRAIAYEADRVQNNITGSSMEKDIEVGINRLKRQYGAVVRDIINIKARLRRVEEDIDNIDIILDELCNEDLELLELKYGSNKTYREIGELLNAAHSTIIRRHNQLIEELIQMF